MSKPTINSNFFYRIRKTKSNTIHKGLFYYNSTLMYGGLDGSTNELWQLSNNKFKNAQTGTYLGGSSGTPILVSSSNAPSFTFEAGSQSDTYYVKASTGKYLNLNSSDEPEWGATRNTAWHFEKLVKLSSIGGFSGNNDYFSEKCGSTSGGTWKKSWTDVVDGLYKALFGIEATQSGAYYNMYGAMYNNTVNPSSYRGKFHTGIDMTNYGGCAVYAPINGEVINVDRDWGVVCIEKSSGVNFVMAHMSNIPASIKIGSYVNKGDEIGNQSNKGLPSGSGTHVHFEVTGGDTLCMTLNSLSSSSIGSTKPPYDYI